jgi:hypothetical protein
VLTNEALEKTLSRERLEKYLKVMNQDIDAALKLYEENTRISEAFYTPLQCLEVCLRNSIGQHLTNAYGDAWFENGNQQFTNDSMTMIFDAIEGLRKDRRPVTQGRVVAELKFAFWVGLMGPSYDATLWRKVIYRAFLARGGRPRSLVHGRFNAIRRFRNRIAHHEPIFDRQILQTHMEIIEAIDWMCRHTSAWAAYHSRVETVLSTRAGEAQA